MTFSLGISYGIKKHTNFDRAKSHRGCYNSVLMPKHGSMVAMLGCPYIIFRLCIITNENVAIPAVYTITYFTLKTNVMLYYTQQSSQ